MMALNCSASQLLWLSPDECSLSDACESVGALSGRLKAHGDAEHPHYQAAWHMALWGQLMNDSCGAEPAVEQAALQAEWEGQLRAVKAHLLVVRASSCPKLSLQGAQRMTQLASSAASAQVRLPLLADWDWICAGHAWFQHVQLDAILA